MPLRAVIFDVDGTLIDSNDQHALAWLKTFRRFGHETPFQRVRAQIGKGGDQLMPVFLDEAEIEARGEEISHYRGELFKREFLPGLQPFPGVRDLFMRLRADGREILLASSATGEELQRYKEIAGVTDLIDGATSGDDATHSKPDPDIFQAALRRAAVPPEEAVVIGDTPYDAIAAVEAGVRPIGVLCGLFPEAVLRREGCSAVFRDPADLLDQYEQAFAS